MHDSLVLISQRVKPDAKLGGVFAKSFDLGSRSQVSNWLIDVNGWGVVIFGCNS